MLFDAPPDQADMVGQFGRWRRVIVIALSFAVILWPLTFALVLTSGLSRHAKLIIAAGMVFAMALVPVVFLLLGTYIGM